VVFTKLDLFEHIPLKPIEKSFSSVHLPISIRQRKLIKNDNMASTEASKAPSKVYGTLSKLPNISDGTVFTKILRMCD
jgi:hypothetical protein